MRHKRLIISIYRMSIAILSLFHVGLLYTSLGFCPDETMTHEILYGHNELEMNVLQRRKNRISNGGIEQAMSFAWRLV